MLNKIRRLIEELKTNGVRYSHWKSNSSLSQVLLGQTDADLLIHRKDADSFRVIMSRLGFRPAVLPSGESFPSLEHYFALDEEAGILVHVHAYYRVITGESLAKNFHFPVEEMLLQNVREESSIRLPIKSVDLIVFTLRMMMKHTSLVELIMLARDWTHVKREIKWLLEAASVQEAVELAGRWLPALNTKLFSECVAALTLPEPLPRRIVLGIRLRSALGGYSRHSRLQAWWIGMRKFASMAFRRLVRSRMGMMPQSGGTVIAFVGPEATGKSTLLAEVSRWLGEHFTVDHIHAGKPRSTLLTVLPNLLIPTLRYMLPTYRSSRIETKDVAGDQPREVYPLIFALRSVFLAFDRRALLCRAFARAANGSIILCDRYPSLSTGAPDSPQLDQASIPRNRYPVRYLLAKIEKRLYEEIPPPDLVVSLHVPVQIALMRNKTRGKEEPEEYVRLRHLQSSGLDFGATPVCRINTDQPLERTVLEVKKAIWDAL